MIAASSESGHSATALSMLKGFFDQLQSYKYLAAINFYQQAISITAPCPSPYRNNVSLPILLALSTKGKKITEFQSSECKVLFPSVTDKDGNVKIDTAAPNLPANQTFKNQNQLFEKQKAKTLKCITGFKASKRLNALNPLSDNPTKWSNTLKQFDGNLLMNCLSVFYHFVKLALEGLK